MKSDYRASVKRKTGTQNKKTKLEQDNVLFVLSPLNSDQVPFAVTTRLKKQKQGLREVTRLKICFINTNAR